MKRILASLVLALALPVGAFASTIALTPSAISVVPGQTFSVTVVVNPQEADYTVETFLSYSAGTLQEVSFTQAAGWLPLSQAGYDSVDNASGRVVKTAGYSGGFSSQKVFGTFTFKAVAAGTATISAADGSQILDANNANSFTSGSRVTVTVATPEPLPAITAQKTAPTKSATNPARTPSAPAKAAVSVAAAPEEASATTAPATTSAEVENVAAVAGARTQDVSLVIGGLTTVLAFGFGILVGRGQKRA